MRKNFVKDNLIRDLKYDLDRIGLESVYARKEFVGQLSDIAVDIFYTKEIRSHLVTFIELILWIQLVDDFFDDSTFSIEVLKKMTNRYKRIQESSIQKISGKRLAYSDRLILLFQNTYHRIIQLAKQNPFGKNFYDSSMNLLDAMMREKIIEENGKCGYEHLEDYLKVGRESIGIKILIWSVLAVGDYSIFSRDIMKKEHLVFDEVASLCRLANDLRTYNKEKSENRISSIHVLSDHGKLTECHAKEMIGEIVCLKYWDLKNRIVKIDLDKNFLQWLLETSQWFMRFYKVIDE